jgi:hypothetical protein
VRHGLTGKLKNNDKVNNAHLMTFYDNHSRVFRGITYHKKLLSGYFKGTMNLLEEIDQDWAIVYYQSKITRRLVISVDNICWAEEIYQDYFFWFTGPNKNR